MSYNPVPLRLPQFSEREMVQRAHQLHEHAKRRRSVRQFSTRPVDRELIEVAVRIAGTAPSGAHKQPWTFVVVQDQVVKQRIRAAAEEEERAFYRERATPEWLEAVAPLGTDQVKTHITDAPYVVVLFKIRHGQRDDGSTEKYYYTAESCGIAAGFFINAIHHMGLATLPHTPSPMGFLADELDRPANEQAYLLLPVGYPSDDAVVPDLTRKPLEHVLVWR